MAVHTITLTDGSTVDVDTVRGDAETTPKRAAAFALYVDHVRGDMSLKDVGVLMGITGGAPGALVAGARSDWGITTDGATRPGRPRKAASVEDPDNALRDMLDRLVAQRDDIKSRVGDATKASRDLVAAAKKYKIAVTGDDMDIIGRLVADEIERHARTIESTKAMVTEQVPVIDAKIARVEALLAVAS